MKSSMTELGALTHVFFRTLTTCFTAAAGRVPFLPAAAAESRDLATRTLPNPRPAPSSPLLVSARSPGPDRSAQSGPEAASTTAGRSA